MLYMIEKYSWEKNRNVFLLIYVFLCFWVKMKIISIIKCHLNNRHIYFWNSISEWLALWYILLVYIKYNEGVAEYDNLKCAIWPFWAEGNFKNADTKKTFPALPPFA